jgi:leucyl aminopeptidase
MKTAFTENEHIYKGTLFVPFISQSATEWQTLAEQSGIDVALIGVDFKAEKGETRVFYTQNSLRMVLIGMGEKADAESFRRSVRLCVQQNPAWLSQSACLDLKKFTPLRNQEPNLLAQLAAAFVAGLVLSRYDIAIYKTKGKKEIPALTETIWIDIPEQCRAETGKAIAEAIIVAEVQIQIMDMVNKPGNRMDAQTLAEYARQAGIRGGFDVKVLDKRQIEQEKIAALLAVNQGSYTDPAFIVMEYKPETTANGKVGLVGKGITFDTGGISMKESTNMGWMKSDMAGGAAVIGIVEAAARLKLPVHLYAVIPATDNMPDGNAIRPGDIIDSYAGLSIEVEDTDAEGRLVLADGVAYVEKNFAPDVMIDMATLTGAVIFALGYQAAGIFTKNETLAQQLVQAGQLCQERVWPLPLWDDYDAQLKSDMADLRNYGGRPAGAVTAAKFIEHFTNKHPAWVHIDIAGTAFADSPFSGSRSATAFGLRLIIEYLKQNFGQLGTY